MSRFFRGVRQFLPPRLGIVLYWVVSLARLILITVGLKPDATGEGGTLWTIPLRNDGAGINVEHSAPRHK